MDDECARPEVAIARYNLAAIHVRARPATQAPSARPSQQLPCHPCRPLG